MRVTQHSSRVSASKRHNDRNFNIENAKHIDSTRTKENVYYNWSDNIEKGLTFEQGELLFYEKYLKQAIENRNKKYLKTGHPEKCRSLTELMKNKQKAPEEIILQIGNKDDIVTKETFENCINEYVDFMLLWNKEHGFPFSVLNMSAHYDEASKHVHIRRIWHYKNEEGFLEIGQNKALKNAGIKLPDENKKEGRFNNRKMSFDKLMREEWVNICKKHGIDVNEEAQLNLRHLEKEEFIRQKIENERIEAQKIKANARNIITSKVKEIAKLMTSKNKGDREKAQQIIAEINKYNNKKTPTSK